MFTKVANAVLKSTDHIPLAFIAGLAVTAAVLTLIAVTSHGLLDASSFMDTMVSALT